MTHVYPFDHPHDLPPSEIKALIGSKAANIVVMAGELGLPVPPGFTVSTAACNAYLAGGWPDGLDDELRAHMRRIEEVVGRRFGDPTDPLLVSVRSGAPISMPGMMDTILNLGLNDATTAGLAASSGDPAFAAACRTRLDTMYREIVGVAAVPADPWEQLREAIQAVFRSWNGERARAYRAHEGIPDDLGTAVTVQAMVFGNRGPDSGTGVLFTRNPATGVPVLYGDVMFNAQGEDVVAGTHETEPISVLDQQMPEAARELRRYAEALERHYADLCDIEFTIERGRLWMLQVRVGKRSPQAALRMAVDMAETDGFPLSREDAVRRVAHLLANPPTITTEREDAIALATGLPASPGVASGGIVTRPEAAVAAASEGRSVILVRAETSPDDVHGMANSAGILTSSGGLASHAAVVARGWGIPAVVGASAVQISPEAVVVGGRRLAVGDVITIDGGTGEVFVGALVGQTTVVPEATTLIGWARELGIEIGAPEAPGGIAPIAEPAVAPTAAAAAVTADDVLRALLIKGFGTPDGMAPALLSTPDEMGSLLDRMVADGLAELAGGMFRLTPDGQAIGRQRITDDQEAWGIAKAGAALDAFVVLDGRVKDIVTAWQMRVIDGEQTFNDHSDQAYDASVLARLDEAHRDAADWLRPIAEELPRLGIYGERLERAASLARAGDHRYVASPRVDSYHSIWFELHEDLILLAGRTRADEVAAGRA